MRQKQPRLPARVAGLLWGVYAWIAFLAGVLAAICFTLVVPGLERRRRWVSACARLPFALSGVDVRVRGIEKIPSGDCVVVANHASYIDGVLLQGYLPPRFSYVIKGEMQYVPVVAYLLKRIGSKFVERFDSRASARDARQLVRAAVGGESLAFFPEGTFVREPGLDRFRAGAFAAAAKAGVPVVPVVISGSRHILPSEAMLPRHGHLRIDVLTPIEPSDPAYANARELAELARQRILAVLDEPDLLAAPEA